MIDGIIQWLDTYESALSAVAALIVIGTVGAALIRCWTATGASGTAPAAGQATPGSPPAPVTAKPSIAVLPFETSGAQTLDEAIADGLTTEIIAGLSSIRQLFVIARNTCFTYKGKRMDVRDVARELGVRYVLEGTVRARSGGGIRVNTQMADAIGGGTVWSRRFDVSEDEVQDIDDLITGEIVAALLPELRKAEAASARHSNVDLSAWARVNAAWLELQNDLSSKDIARQAIREIEDVLKTEPDFALAHGVLAHAYSLTFELGLEGSESVRAEREKSMEHARRAVQLDPDDPAIHHLVGSAMANFRMSEDGRSSFRRALELNPDYAPAVGALGVSLMYAPNTLEAKGYLERALRLSPREPHAYHWQGHLALAYCILGEPQKALEYARLAVERRPTIMGRSALFTAYALLGMRAEATTALDDLRKALPETLGSDDYVNLLDTLVADKTRRAEILDAVRPYVGSQAAQA